MKHDVTPPLTNIQQELLKLFSTNIPEEQLKELKSVISNFLLEKAGDKADAIWNERKYDSA